MNPLDRLFPVPALIGLLLLAGLHATPVAVAEVDVPVPKPSAALQSELDRIVDKRLRTTRPRLAAGALHVAVIDLADPRHPRLAHYNGYEPVYPASVVKMFYMGCVYQFARQDGLRLDREVRRKLREMIYPSSNVATGWVVDHWSGVRNDSLMDAQTHARFADARNKCNRWLASLGIDGINANQKTWGDSIPPGEKQFLRDGARSGPYTNRNSMTAVAGARFLQWIAMDVLVDAEASKEMKQLMERDPRKQRYQRFRIAGGAPKGARVYSKSGTTSDTFHDAGIVELADGHRFVLVVLVEGKGMKSAIIRDLSADLGALFGRCKTGEQIKCD